MVVALHFGECLVGVAHLAKRNAAVAVRVERREESSAVIEDGDLTRGRDRFAASADELLHFLAEDFAIAVRVDLIEQAASESFAGHGFVFVEVAVVVHVEFIERPQRDRHRRLERIDLARRERDDGGRQTDRGEIGVSLAVSPVSQRGERTQHRPTFFANDVHRQFDIDW